MSFSAEKHLFQGLMGSCPSPPKNREILDGIFEFEVFFFFIIQDNTVERDVRFSKYLKFRVYFRSLRSRYRKVPYTLQEMCMEKKEG